MLAPFVLRRIKGDVLDQLVPKKTVIEAVTMTKEQKQIYNDILTGHTVRKKRTKEEQNRQIEHERFLATLGSKRSKKKTKTGATVNAVILC
jgi:SNF2 family DNA or RNA helicase